MKTTYVRTLISHLLLIKPSLLRQFAALLYPEAYDEANASRMMPPLLLEALPLRTETSPFLTQISNSGPLQEALIVRG